MSEQLTANTCARLNNPTNYTVLVSNPVLKVVEITDANMKLWDFVVTWVATVTDGESTAQVVLPSSLCIWASGTGPHRMVSQDDVIKVQRMLRLPHEDTSVVLVHDIEINLDKDVPLEVTDYEAKIESLQTELTKAETTLRRVLQEQHDGVTPTLVDSVMELVMSVNDAVEEAM